MHVSYVYLQEMKALMLYAEIFHWTVTLDFVSSLDSLKKLFLWLVCSQKNKIYVVEVSPQFYGVPWFY